MLIPCDSNHSAGGGLQLVPSPDELTRLLMTADRVTESEFDALLRQVSKSIGARTTSDKRVCPCGFI